MESEKGRLDDGEWNLTLHPPFSPFHFPFSIFRTQRASSLVEMALTLPIMIVVLIGTIDLGRGVYAQNVISNAAREGARYGTTSPSDVPGIQARAESYIVGLDMNAVSTSVTQPSSDTIRVTVTYQFTAATPLVGNLLGGGGTVTLQGVSTMMIEGAG